MALRCSFDVMAILLAKSLILLGASLQRWCQLQEAGVPLTDAIAFQSGVVPVVAMGVIKFFMHPCRFGVAVSPVGSRWARGGDLLGGAGEEGLGEGWEKVVAMGAAV